MGRVIDEKIASDLTQACHGFSYIDPKTGEKRFLLWRTGIIGTLNDEQEKKYCDMKIAQIQEGLTRRLEERFQILRGLEKLEEECPCLTKVEKEDFFKIIEASDLSLARKGSLKKSIEDIITC